MRSCQWRSRRYLLPAVARVFTHGLKAMPLPGCCSRKGDTDGGAELHCKIAGPAIGNVFVVALTKVGACLVRPN